MRIPAHSWWCTQHQHAPRGQLGPPGMVPALAAHALRQLLLQLLLVLKYWARWAKGLNPKPSTLDIRP